MQEKTGVISINGVDYVRKDSIQETKPLGDEVIVRTYSAGVHVGNLVSLEGATCVLSNARRIWKWAGAFTLNEIALQGVDRKNSRICKPVPTITLTQAIEVIPVVSGVNLSTTE
jgi:hypothetical protein